MIRRSMASQTIVMNGDRMGKSHWWRQVWFHVKISCALLPNAQGPQMTVKAFNGVSLQIQRWLSATVASSMELTYFVCRSQLPCRVARRLAKWLTELRTLARAVSGSSWQGLQVDDLAEQGEQ